MKRYVLGFCFGPQLDKVTLIKKTRPAWQAGRLNGIGGHIEDGETPTEAMMREFREEADCQDNLSWVNFGRLSCDGWEVHLFYSVRDFCPGPFNVHEEGQVNSHHVSSVLTGVSQDTPVMPKLKYLIPMALNHQTGADSAAYFEIKELTGKPPVSAPKKEEPPLTEARVRELIAEGLRTIKCPCSPAPLAPPVYPTPTAPPWLPRPAIPPVMLLYMAQTSEPPPGWVSATISSTPPRFQTEPPVLSTFPVDTEAMAKAAFESAPPPPEGER